MLQNIIRRCPAAFRTMRKFKYLGLFLFAFVIILVNAFISCIFAGVFLVILYLAVLYRVIRLYFFGVKDSLKTILYLIFILVLVHVGVGINAAYINSEMESERKKITEPQMSPGRPDEYGIPFFTQPYFYSGIKVVSTDFSDGEVLDCSSGEGIPEFLCSKIYKDAEGTDFSFTVTYYPENIQGTSKITLGIRLDGLVDSEEKEVGRLTYVLYGSTDHYCNVNTKIQEMVYATYIINPVQGEWKNLKVDSIINDYNKAASKLGGKSWDELNVIKVTIGINSWSTDGGWMSVYLKGLDVKRKNCIPFE